MWKQGEDGAIGLINLFGGARLSGNSHRELTPDFICLKIFQTYTIN